MKKLSLLFSLIMGSALLMAQPFEVINWINLDEEPDYAANPYNKAEYIVTMAPAEWTPVTDMASFNATWGILGDSAAVANPGNVSGGDLFDLDAADPSFGAAWKAVYDENNLYVLLKYWDLNGEAATGVARSFEIMAQTHPDTDMETGRYTPDFIAAGDDVALQKASYGRFIELAGGKTVFGPGGGVEQYDASVGLAGGGTFTTYGPGIQGLAESTHFWDSTDVIHAVLVMPFATTLSYPTDPLGDLAVTTAFDPTLTPGADTIVFDVKSNAKVGGTEDANKVEYWWSSNANNGYAMNYYSGRLIFEAPTGILDYINGRSYAKVYMHNDILHVRGEQPADVEIYSISGSLVKAATQTNEVNMSNLNNGVYIVRLNGSQNAYKVIK